MQQPCACPKKGKAETDIQNERRLMPWRKLLHSRLGQLENLQPADTCSTADPMTASLPPKYTSKAFALPGSGRIASKNTTSCTLHCIWGAVVSESSQCTCWLQQQEQNKTIKPRAGDHNLPVQARYHAPNRALETAKVHAEEGGEGGTGVRGSSL